MVVVVLVMPQMAVMPVMNRYPRHSIDSPSRAAKCGVGGSSQRRRRPTRLHSRCRRWQSVLCSINDTGTDGGGGETYVVPSSPLLPEVSSVKRITLVRHGQSTWNAIGRMQGSSDFSVLTEKGKSQAETTSVLLRGERFDKVFSSPLRRATETAMIVWGTRAEKEAHDGQELPSYLNIHDGLREIDLYSFQGLDKNDAKVKFPKEYRMWKDNAENFEIDGHYPVRELWSRARLVWNDILPSLRDDVPENILIVAHNAVNQALIGTALGLQPFHFRRLVQSNAAATVINFLPASISGVQFSSLEYEQMHTDEKQKANGRSDGPVTVLDGLNETPEVPLLRSAGARLILICNGTSQDDSDESDPSLNRPCSQLGKKQIEATGEMLKEFEIDHILCSPMMSAQQSAEIIAEMNSSGIDEIEVCDALRDRLGSQQNFLLLSSPFGKRDSKIDSAVTSNTGHGHADGPGDVTSGTVVNDEPMLSVWNRAGMGWATALKKVQNDNGTVVIVSHATVNSAMLCRCLALSSEFVPRINLSHGSVSIVKFPDGALGGPGIIETCNFTKHLEEGWSVPVFQNEAGEFASSSNQLEGF